MKKSYETPELELQENPDVITTSGEINSEETQVETKKFLFRF